MSTAYALTRPTPGAVQERLALTYGQRFSFAISRNDGYRVEIEIPAAG